MKRLSEWFWNWVMNTPVGKKIKECKPSDS